MASQPNMQTDNRHCEVLWGLKELSPNNTAGLFLRDQKARQVVQMNLLFWNGGRGAEGHTQLTGKEGI